MLVDYIYKSMTLTINGGNFLECRLKGIKEVSNMPILTFLKYKVASSAITSMGYMEKFIAVITTSNLNLIIHLVL
jgi:hypothetical protein